MSAAYCGSFNKHSGTSGSGSRRFFRAARQTKADLFDMKMERMRRDERLRCRISSGARYDAICLEKGEQARRCRATHKDTGMTHLHEDVCRHTRDSRKLSFDPCSTLTTFRSFFGGIANETGVAETNDPPDSHGCTHLLHHSHPLQLLLYPCAVVSLEDSSPFLFVEPLL